MELYQGASVFADNGPVRWFPRGRTGLVNSDFAFPDGSTWMAASAASSSRNPPTILADRDGTYHRTRLRQRK